MPLMGCFHALLAFDLSMSYVNTANPKRFNRRWFQYSLRTLLLFAILISAWMAWWSYNARQQREAVAAIDAAGGIVAYDFEQRGLSGPSSWPKVMVDTIGVDYFADVHHVALIDEHTTDATLEPLQKLTTLRSLLIQDLEFTDAGLKHLEGLIALEVLYLEWTQVTDAGLPHLESLTKLRELHLPKTKITDAGVKRLQIALPNCKIIH